MQDLLAALGSKNTFRPHVLAKVWRDDSGFVGSSIAVSSFLRPLCLHERVIHFKSSLRKAVVFAEPLQRPLRGQASRWSSMAYRRRSVKETDSDKAPRRYNKRKDPCKNCQEMFKNLSGFISVEGLDSPRAETFWGACAEYCPVNELIADVGRDTDPQMDNKLRRHRKRCISLFKGIRNLCELANKLDVKKEDNDKKLTLKHAAKPLVNEINIFGLSPGCEM